MGVPILERSKEHARSLDDSSHGLPIAVAHPSTKS